MTSRNSIGIVMVCFLVLCAIIIARQGQLLTLSGRIDHPPAYDIAAVPPENPRSFDSRTYDASGKPVDFTAIPGRIDDIPSGSDQCRDLRYIYAFQNMKLWKKAALLAVVETALQDEINAYLEACPAPVTPDFSCASGCAAKGADDVTVAQPLSLTLLSADAAGLGVLQYIFSASGGCSRVRHCTTAPESSATLIQ